MKRMKPPQKPLFLLLGTSLLTGITPLWLHADENTTAAPVTMPEVQVQGQQEKQGGTYNSKVISNPKAASPILDTPQSTSVVPAQVIQDQNMTTLRDVLHNVSGISVAAGEGGNQGDSITIRGFNARTDIFLDGMRNFGSYFRDTFNFEQVEVLKGPAATSFGRGSTGGVVNQVSKVPQIDPVTAGSLSAGSDATIRATMDVNRAVPSLGDNAHARINMVSHKSEVAGRQFVENRRFGFAPSISWGLGTAKRTTLSFFKLSANDVPDYGLPFLFNKVAPVNRTNFYGFKNANHLDTDVNIATLKHENSVSDKTTVTQQLRVASYERSFMIGDARVPGTVTPGTAIETINVDRNQIAGESTETSMNYDINVKTNFDTGSVNHTLTVGAEAIKETSNPTRYRWTGVPQTSLLNPADVPFTGTGSVNTITDASAVTGGVYVMDTLKLSERWEVTGQARYDYLESMSQQTTPSAAKLTRYDNMLSTRGGIVFKPSKEGSIYATYATSFNPSIEQLSLSAANVNAEPEKNRVYEIGTKWELLDGDLTLSGAVFQTEKENARTPDVTDPTVNVLEGKHKAQGVEVEVAGNLTKSWQVFAGYAYSDSEITESNTAAEVGQRLANAPLNTGSLWTTYQINSKWQVGGGVKAVSDRVATLTRDTQTGLLKTVDGYNVYDAMAKYQYAKDISVQLNFYNIDDKFYIDGVHGSHLIPGAGRSATLTTNFNF
ncbi:MAG: TonB-dependent siderophore receptor [Pseudobdellovibrio sp.]|nr:TonB-dependent siderophore receptor [Pseudobdellovibrio sp.]